MSTALIQASEVLRQSPDPLELVASLPPAVTSVICDGQVVWERDALEALRFWMFDESVYYPAYLEDLKRGEALVPAHIQLAEEFGLIGAEEAAALRALVSDPDSPARWKYGVTAGLDKPTAISRFAYYGQLAAMRRLRQLGCPWDEWTCAWAARGGHLDCLRYAHENGCPWDEWTCAFASSGGHLDCLRYAHENDCPWDEWTCAFAAKKGRLHCLRYAHENGCPWDVFTPVYAAENGHLDCLRYAKENGCAY